MSVVIGKRRPRGGEVIVMVLVLVRDGPHPSVPMSWWSWRFSWLGGEGEVVRVVGQLVRKGKRKNARESLGLSKKPLLSSFEAVVTSCDQTTCSVVPRPPFDLESISSLCYKRADPIKSPQLATYAICRRSTRYPSGR